MPGFSPLYAHAFGLSFSLPLPLWLYLYGAAATVILSFLVLGVISPARQAAPGPRLVIPFGPLAGGVLRGSLQIVGIVGFLMILIAGFFGNPLPLKNIAVPLVWLAVFLIGAHVQLLITGWWSALNPWRTIFKVAEDMRGKKLGGLFDYPEKLGYWPATVFLMVALWFELVVAGFATVPINLAIIVISYSVVTFTGMVLFGKDTWLNHGELLTVLYSLFGRLSIIKVNLDGVYVNRPQERLLAPIGMGLLLFVIALMAGTLFDGWRETVAFGRLFIVLQTTFGITSVAGNQFLQAFIYLSMVAVLVILYIASLTLVRRLAGYKHSLLHYACVFGLSLLPIAVGYHLSHYIPLIIIEGQRLFALISDPLGRGENIFGTAGYIIDPNIISTKSLWYIQVGLILIGHVIGVYVSHRIAQASIKERTGALLSQYPMLAFMVGLTIFSLWVLSQPLVTGA